MDGFDNDITSTDPTNSGLDPISHPDVDNPGNDQDWRDPFDTDGDGIADIDDLDDDNDGIPDEIECPIFDAGNGDLDNPIMAITPNQQYIRVFDDGASITYTNEGSSRILPFSESTSTATDLYAVGTEISYVYPDPGAIQRMDLSEPMYAQFAVTDIDQASELHRVTVYDENGVVIPDPASYITSTAEGTACLLYTSPSPRDLSTSRMPSSA